MVKPLTPVILLKSLIKYLISLLRPLYKNHSKIGSYKCQILFFILWHFFTTLDTGSFVLILRFFSALQAKRDTSCIWVMDLVIQLFFSSPFIVKKMYYFVILSKYSLLNWLIVYSPQRMAQFHLHKIFWNEKQNLYLPIQMSIPLLFFGFYIRFIIKNGISQECNHWVLSFLQK